MKISFLRKVLLFTFCFLSFYTVKIWAQTKLYVNSTAATGGNGSSWAAAFGNLQEALTIADNNLTTEYEVYVAAGTYKPNTMLGDGSTNRDKAFGISRAIKIYGGYDATTGLRNVSGNSTILSGDIDNTPSNNSGNAYHVLVIVSIDNVIDSIVIDGFTVKDGNAISSNPTIGYAGAFIDRHSGGGIYVTSNSYGDKIAIRNCVLTNNSGGSAAGMFNYGASPSLFNCTISNNRGRGVSNLGSNSIFTNCTFSNNVFSAGQGGAMSNLDSSVKLINCTLSNNRASLEGGGVMNTNSTTSFLNCILSENVSVSNGGAIYDSSSTSLLTNCILFKNSAVSGGGIYGDISAPTLPKSILSLTNCTLVGNSSTGAGQAVYYRSSSIVNLKNTVVWKKDYTGNDQINSSIINASYSLIQRASGVYAGISNINTNPLFVDSENPKGADGLFNTIDDGLIPQVASPLINSGDVIIGNNSDISGKQRVSGNAIDIGAYEYQEGVLPVKLTSYVVKNQNNIVKLEWHTSSENFNNIFIVFRNGDLQRPIKLGEIVSKGNGGGMYTFYDHNPLVGHNYYKLMQQDNNGNVEELGVKELKINIDDNVLHLYPNPTKGKVSILFPPKIYDKLWVVSITGNRMYTKVIKADTSIEYLDLSTYPSGIYFAKLSGSDDQKTVKIVKVD